MTTVTNFQLPNCYMIVNVHMTDNLSSQMVVRFFKYYCKKNIKKKNPLKKNAAS